MPIYKDVEVWLEDSEHRKLHHHGVSIDLVDDRTVTVKTDMLRDEPYTVHCLSPMSVFCEVFVISAFGRRRRAARFHLDKSIATSKDVSTSSVDHTEGLFKDRGLRTPKRQYLQGKLGSVEVEIRRTDGIIKAEPRGEHELVDGGEECETEFFMIDDFGQMPWLVFRFDIGVKPPPVPSALATKHTKRHVVRRIPRNQSQASSGRNSNTDGSGNETSHECLPGSKKHSKCDGSASVGGSLTQADPERLKEEYRKEEVEEQRLLQKLQARLQAKKTRNIELRRLLGEAQ